MEKLSPESTLGGVAEWSKAPVLKTGVSVRAPRVRIPPPPPVVLEIGLNFSLISQYIFRSIFAKMTEPQRDSSLTQVTNDKVKNYIDNLSDDRKSLFKNKDYDVWNFGNDALLQLVLEGKKVATAGLLAQHNKVPQVGDLGIITDSQDEPRCIVEYTNIETKPFLEVDFDFAQAEGEGFQNIEDWRNEHQKVFREWTNNAFTDNDLVLCENFKLVYSNSK